MSNGIWVIPTYSRCAPHVIKTLRNVAERISWPHAIRHRLFVLVSGDQALIHAGGLAFGYFDPSGPRIHIAGGVYRLMRSRGKSAKDAREELIDTLLHEFVHYEQFRDGKPLTERGVNQRASSLMRKLGLGGGR